MINIYRKISLLIHYCLKQKFITGIDSLYVRNLLLDYFHLTDFVDAGKDKNNSEPVQPILDRMVDYAFKNQMIKTGLFPLLI